MEPQRDGLVQVIELKLVQPVIAIVVSITIINLTYFIAKKTVQKKHVSQQQQDSPF